MKLYGYARPVSVGPLQLPADHTYVKGGGRKWGCFGGSSGGHEVCRGDGDVDQVNCRSHPRSSGYYAGLVYGVDGVCHQAANRLLHGTGQQVSGAEGYLASFLTYGTYGKNTVEWAERRDRCANA